MRKKIKKKLSLCSSILTILEYESVEEFLAAIKKEFGRGEEESMKVAELKKLE